MFELMQSVLLVFIEIMCCKIFYETFGKVRYKGWINIIQFVLLLGSMCLIAFGFSSHFTIRQIAIVLMFSVFMLWHVKISLKKSFVLAILFDALLLAMDYLVYLINRRFSLGSELLGWQYQVGRILQSLLAKIVLFLLILIIRKWFGKKSMEMLSDTEWLRFLFFPLFTIVAISAMLSVLDMCRQWNRRIYC